MKKYILILIFTLIGISAAYAAKVTCPIKHNGKELWVIGLISNGHNNYLHCQYADKHGGGLVLYEYLPSDKNIFTPINVAAWNREYSNLQFACASLLYIKRPVTDAFLQAASEKCAVFECPRKGACIL